jgi:gliding motility-associated-like protein
MKKILLLLFSICTCFASLATHTKGGWMYYEYLGQGIQDPTKLRYRIGMNFYMDCPSNIIEPNYNFSIFQGAAPYTFIVDAPVNLGTTIIQQNCNGVSCYPCISVIPTICYKILNYETIVELTPSPTGFIVAKQRCCRINNISNLRQPSDDIGATLFINIPGTVAGLPNAFDNTSPNYIFKDTSIVCAESLFSLSFAATDADGDSLRYSFCDAFTGGIPTDPNPITASAPPFTPVAYQAPFTGTSPLGAAVTINPQTGIISGIAPAAGEYVVSICVAEYRNGIRFAESRKELHLKITPCIPVAATLDPDFVTCGDLNLSFFNQSDNSSIQNWYWLFGDPASGANDSSLLQNPSHSFSAPGIYTIKLIVNRGLPCVDSATQVVRVFPGFFPGFDVMAPFCVGQPLQFDDTTQTNFGTVNQWFWNFGDPNTLADTSRLQNPTFTYTAPGTFMVKLISANSLGCRDSVETQVTVHPNPVLNLISPDSTYCALDSLVLSASGVGNFSWTPNTNILNAGTANPTVFPAAPTTYLVTLENMGCTSRDSVRLNPINDLTNNITALPTSICEGDTLLLTGTSNKSNVSWQWNPALLVASPNTAITAGFPTVTSNFSLQTKWGNHCIATANINIPVTALAIPNAGADANFCLGQTPIALSASGGTSYSWSPSAGLSNTNTASPVASPTSTNSYVVSVGVNGCSRTRNDTVLVTVRNKPLVAITNDTLICVPDTLQLNASGVGTFLWTPNYMINDVNTQNPLVSPDVPTRYRLRHTDVFGCFTEDSLWVDVKALATIDAGPDTSICVGNGYTLRTTGDAVSYTWIPATYLSDPNIKNPFANPPNTITYTLVGNIGKCEAQSNVTIVVGPTPAANAGPDTTLCFGSSVQLIASGGSSYSWSPGTFLTNRNIANPIVQSPTTTIRYIVTVRDTLGCTKTVNDTMIVRVIPPIQVNAGPSDTSIVEGETLQLLGTGALQYMWSPPTWLNNANVANPVAIPFDNITYYLTGRDNFGCEGFDSIRVRIFNIDPDMYVPTAFTPNGDGLNDLARPILLGMKSLNYFRIYNRFGELVYATTEIGKGWNGIFKGKPQDPATFVWMAEGITFNGQRKTKKGYVILIR